MLIELLSNTPLYVYWIFFSLLFVGLSQTKTRNVGLKRAVLIPLILILFSIYAIINDFGINLLSMSIWIGGIILVLGLNKSVKSQKEVYYSNETKIFIIEGSFLPLFMMMLLFFTKYSVGIVSINDDVLFHTNLFISIASFFYGIFTGMYLLRFLVLIQKLKSN